MYGRNLFDIYLRLRNLGLTESERSFGRWLGRAPQYLRDHRQAGGFARVSPIVVTILRRRLTETAQVAPPGLAQDLRDIIRQIERDVAVHAALAR